MATAAMLAGVAAARLSGQPASSPGAVLEGVSRYVEQYYARAQRLMVEETVMVQPVGRDLMPDGFARHLVYDLRFEWKPDAENEKGRVDVVRELLRANRRPAKPDDEPKCLDPAPVTPEPLEFLLPGRHADYTFKNGGRTMLDGKEALVLEFIPRSSGTPKATLDPKGTGDKECVSMDVPRRYRGRIWIDPATHAVRRIDENLIGPTDVPLPKELLRRPSWGNGPYITLSRADSSVRYSPVSFEEPEETLMLPTAIENVWITIAGTTRGVRMTQEYRNYRRFLTESRIVQE
jgi:hypothetical protein